MLVKGLNIITSILLFLLLIGCETIIQIDIPEETEKLVINSELSNGNPITAEIYKSAHILSDNDFYYGQLDYNYNYPNTIELYVNNELVETQEYQYVNYKHQFSTICNPNNTYRIAVHNELLGTAYGQASLETKPSVDSARIISSVDEEYQSEFILSDPGNESYYLVELFKYDTITQYVYDSLWNILYSYDTTVKNNVWISSSIMEFNDAYLTNNGALIFSNDFFKGKKITIDLRYNVWNQFNNNPTYYLAVSSISEAYYNYLVSWGKQSYSGSDPFSEPVIVYNNIENGYGILGSRNDSILVLQ